MVSDRTLNPMLLSSTQETFTKKKKTLLESTRRREISQQIPTIPFHTIVPDHSHEPSKLQMFGHLNFFLKKCITQIRNHIEMKPI